MNTTGSHDLWLLPQSSPAGSGRHCHTSALAGTVMGPRLLTDVAGDLAAGSLKALASACNSADKFGLAAEETQLTPSGQQLLHLQPASQEFQCPCLTQQKEDNDHRSGHES